MRYVFAFMIFLLPAIAHAGTDGIGGVVNVANENAGNSNDAATQGAQGQGQGLGSNTIKLKNNGLKLKPPANANAAKLHNLEVSMKSLKQKMDSINGLEQEQQVRLQHMQDLLQKMMALLGSMQE